jgi:nucleoside-diphosphate-sugar epimerase
MMHVVVIGGTGHIGTYLIPRLVEGGAAVTVVSRQQREPYQSHAVWKKVKHLTLDREKLEQENTFGTKIRELKLDVVIDLICFTPESNKQLVEALRGHIQHFLHCGTIWVHGHSTEVPTTEDTPRYPFGEYGINKAAIEKDLLNEARRNGFPATILHPGHIVGPGWNPLNPAGHFNPNVFTTLAKGEALALPNFGLETVHHVHADDVAQMFVKAMTHWNSAVGESFHTVSPAALTLRGYAEGMAAWFGKTANLSFLPFEQWKTSVSNEEATATWEHIARSPSSSIEKARRLLGYAPRYRSLEAVQESVTWLIQQGKVII